MFEERMLELDAIRQHVAQHCLCEMGARRVRALTPMVDEEELRQQIALVREYGALLDARLEPPLNGLRDVAGHLARLRRERSTLEPDEFLHLSDFITVAGLTRRYFESMQVETPGLHFLAMPLSGLPHLLREIDARIAPNATVRDQASDVLARVRAEIRQVEAAIHRQLDAMVKELGASGDLQDNFFTLRNGRYVLPVKTNCRGRVKGIYHDSSNTGETVFIEPYAILDLSNSLSDLRVQEREEVYRILLALGSLCRADINALYTNLEILSDFDLIHARARFGQSIRGAFPVLTGIDKPPSLINAHHPLLYVNDAERSRPLTLPLDLSDLALVITGPNAGGKTTALKTIGLTALMVQCAIPVPLDARSRMPVFTHILADIGDEQDVLGGLSTFSAHMKRLAGMMKIAGEGATLVLLDELGTATDPAEGGALAIAVLETLADRGCLTMATSHLPSLKTWALQHPNGRNASFRLSDKDRTPTFKLTLDLPGISEAFTIAERAGLPPDVIARARNLRPDGESDTTALLLKLQEKESRLDDALAKHEEMELNLLVREEELEKLSAKLRDEKRSMKRDMLDEKERELAGLRAQVERLIAEGRPAKEDLLSAKRALEGELDATARQVVEAGRQPKATDAAGVPVSGKLQPGDRVRVETFGGEEGTVLEVYALKGEARVALRKITTTARFGDLKLLKGRDQQERLPARVQYKRPEAPESVLDLHGCRVEEAVNRFEKFLDQALLAGFGTLRIVHGQGTGKLGKALHDHFRRHLAIRAFRYALPHEGGGGVTIVEVK